MRHKNSGRKFDRNTSSRRAMLRNLTANLDPARADRDDGRQGEGAAARRGAAHHQGASSRARSRTPRRPSSLPPTRRGGSLRRASIAAYIPRFGVRIETGGAPNRVDLVEKVLLDLAQALRDPARGLHAHREVRAASGRQRPHLAHRARGRLGRQGRQGRQGKRRRKSREHFVQDRDGGGAYAGRESRIAGRIPRT